MAVIFVKADSVGWLQLGKLHQKLSRPLTLEWVAVQEFNANYPSMAM